MSTLLDEFVKRHANVGIVLDTNVALLFFVASHDRQLVPRFKRTVQFTPEDYDLLVRLLRLFVSVVTTPHLLTEVTNLAGQLAEPARTAVMSQIAFTVPTQTELYTTAHALVAGPAFLRLELADSAVLDLCSKGYGVLTDDSRLASEIWSRGMGAVNFNHLRFRV